MECLAVQKWHPSLLPCLCLYTFKIPIPMYANSEPPSPNPWYVVIGITQEGWTRTHSLLHSNVSKKCESFLMQSPDPAESNHAARTNIPEPGPRGMVRFMVPLPTAIGCVGHIYQAHQEQNGTQPGTQPTRGWHGHACERIIPISHVQCGQSRYHMSLRAKYQW